MSMGFKDKLLVSVIVPIFNTELYLSDCIKSILTQSHKNIEVILVNDGSTDSSGEIADKFAKNDNRIKIIHQANKGVSCARNVALDVAVGSWVMFVDSDDMLPKDSIKTMLQTAIELNTDCVCGNFLAFTKNIINNNFNSRKNKIVLDKSEAVSLLLYQGSIANAPFAKLYSMKCIGKIRFREDIYTAEDLLFNFLVLKNLDNVVLIEDIIYSYRKHSESVINRSFSKKRMSGLKATSLILTDIKKQNLPIAPAINRHFMEALFIISQLSSREVYKEYYSKCKIVILDFRKFVFFDSHSPIMYRFFAFLSLINPVLAIYIYKAKTRLGNIRIIKGLLK